MIKQSDALRFAIVGSGGIAQTHAEALARIREAKLIAVSSRNIETARRLAASAKAQAFDSLEAMLQTASIDAVLIATPSGTHEEIAVPCLKAGRHVLCEKPLEISTVRVQRMIAEARQAGVLLGGFFPLRCGRGPQVIRSALDKGRFGRLTMLSARVKWWRDQDYFRNSSWRGIAALDGGGALMNQGIHAVDLIQWLGGEVHEVSAFSSLLAHQGLEVEDTLVANLRFANGALGTIEAATSCYPGLDLSLEISGDRGSAILINDRIEYWKFAKTAKEDELILANSEAGSIRGGTSNPLAITSEGHRVQISEFCQAIRGQLATPILAPEAAKAVAIVEAIYTSARSMRAEPVSFS